MPKKGGWIDTIGEYPPFNLFYTTEEKKEEKRKKAEEEAVRALYFSRAERGAMHVRQKKMMSQSLTHHPPCSSRTLAGKEAHAGQVGSHRQGLHLRRC